MDGPAPARPRRRPSVADLAAGLAAGDRASLARAITLIESTNPKHRADAHGLLQQAMPHSGKAHRIGVTGVPGVGKSTTIEAFGCYLTGLGHRVAVLAVDPSSSRSGGSILGDKTRMEKLGADPNAFIRPSPSAGTLGGVARATRETMLLCEAAGYDVILVETVGVGQSETVVAEMVDVFLVLMLPGAGDELQGIKKGILELADVIAVNKADGDNVQRAESAAQSYRGALHIMTPTESKWQPQVLCMSGATGAGLDKLWETLRAHHDTLHQSGELAEKRRHQRSRWMWSMVDDRLREELRGHPRVQSLMTDLEKAVYDGDLNPSAASERIIGAFLGEKDWE
ncbi:methylmalonyl Co-A mutase-associated GTPase MeaB [Magnetospira sp. QH-2]|uniref:methylmalonyl Co-A mutase-associated GTPase MeaB n=1 Tax=Magnetospira sp. (strain QH-2) TaxID=1288970 RepID=UPI0003E811D9|nr:methylmalonyl Co-A mutase-associated GTPase MeaB [Magnetospira sp. QH-2]CCQ73375.1 Membrane ATPase/protein kinase [Magnetospira sp. QH-2]